MWPTMMLATRLFENERWPQSWPSTNRPVNAMPASRMSASSAGSCQTRDSPESMGSIAISTCVAAMNASEIASETHARHSITRWHSGE